MNGKDLVKWQTGKSVKVKSTAKVPRFSKEKYIKQKNREKVSQRKIKKAVNASRMLSTLPTVSMVGVTGSLAMHNAGKGSDIDLLIITSSGTLWSTRMMAIVMLLLKGWEVRRAGKPENPDSLCLNAWMDEKDLSIKPQNIFTAHELCQIKVLYDKNNVYKKLISTNAWVKNYWPNASNVERNNKKIDHSIYGYLIVRFLRLLEPILRAGQFRYMRKKRTREVITNTRAFFHPIDWGDRVEKELAKRGVIVT